MHIPAIFKQENTNKVKNFINENSFAILINQVDNRPWATHIPLVLTTNKNQDVLQGHISKTNKQWKNFNENDEVLVIFNGPHAYISSSWYDHENVPTYNYTAVHVYGKIKISTEEELREQLNSLINKYEKGKEKAVKMAEMNTAFINKEIKGIVGFEITITEIQAAEKLSQNRNSKNKSNIVKELNKKGCPNAKEVAELMKRK